MGTLEYPVGDIFVIQGPEGAEADAVQSLVDTHVAGSGRGRISQKNRLTEGGRNNTQHQEFLIVLHTLEPNKTVVNNRDVITENVVRVGRVDVGKRARWVWFGFGKVSINESSVRVVSIGGSPVGNGRDRGANQGLCNEGAGEKFGWQVVCIKKGE
jgi:hypothetical protein